jgi:Pentapeptide repeats (8 copies)
MTLICGGADLSGVYIFRSYVLLTNFEKANLRASAFEQSNLRGANLRGTDLRDAYLYRTNLTETDISGADLRGAHLREANLYRANLAGTDLSGAVLERASFVECNLQNANISGCRVYRISAWGLKLEGANQSNLVMTPPIELDATFYVVDKDGHLQGLYPLPGGSFDTRPPKPVTPVDTITVDNLEMAQFLYLLLNNQKIREVVDSITSKAVLILGRFTPSRKRVLDAIRDALRRHNYLPILFDFESPSSRDLTETITTLARLARFIVADLTEPSSVAKELEAIVPTLAVPVQPLLEGSSRPYSMFRDHWKYGWVLDIQRYEGPDELVSSLEEKVIRPAEQKLQTLMIKRAGHADALIR